MPTIITFKWRYWGKPLKIFESKQSVTPAGIWTRYFPSTSHKFYHLGPFAWYEKLTVFFHCRSFSTLTCNRSIKIYSSLSPCWCLRDETVKVLLVWGEYEVYLGRVTARGVGGYFKSSIEDGGVKCNRLYYEEGDENIYSWMLVSYDVEGGENGG
jgi:hypothetical protein